MTVFNASSPIVKLLVASVLVAGSLVSVADSAIADSPHAVRVVHGHAPVHAARQRAAPYYGYAQPGFDIGQFIGAMLGGPLPPQYAQIVGDAMPERGRYATAKGIYVPGTELPTYSDPVPVDNSASDANAGIAAAQQTEINAGMQSSLLQTGAATAPVSSINGTR